MERNAEKRLEKKGATRHEGWIKWKWSRWRSENKSEQRGKQDLRCAGPLRWRQGAWMWCRRWWEGGIWWESYIVKAACPWDNLNSSTVDKSERGRWEAGGLQQSRKKMTRAWRRLLLGEWSRTDHFGDGGRQPAACQGNPLVGCETVCLHWPSIGMAACNSQWPRFAVASTTL